MDRVTLSKDRGLSIGEEQGKCCLCFDIKTGVNLIGAFVVVYAVFAAWGIITIASVDITTAIVFAVLVCPVLLSGYHFAKYL